MRFPKIDAALISCRQVLLSVTSSSSATAQEKEEATHRYLQTCLFYLRQLKFHTMHTHIDGWNQGDPGRRILIVDPSRKSRQFLVNAFANANFLVEQAAESERAFELMKHFVYEAVFVDIETGNLEGLELATRFRKWEGEARTLFKQPICALTAQPSKEGPRREPESELLSLKDAGFDMLERKPPNITRLLKVVNDLSIAFQGLSTNVKI